MSIFSASINHRSFYWQISALCFVLGLLLAAAVVTSSQINHTGAVSTRPGFFYGDNSGINVGAEKQNAKCQQEIQKLRADKTTLEKALFSRTDASRTLGTELQETKLLAGLIEV